jgi:hypothetical protein
MPEASATAVTLEQELRLMIKTLTNLGYSEWTSVSDQEVRTGSPRAYCTFIRYLFDCHPRVLQMLLTSKTPDGDIHRQHVANFTNSKVRNCAEGNLYAPKPGQPLPRSSINKYVADTTIGHPPRGSAYHTSSKSANNNNNTSTCAAVGTPSFIVEQDDVKFMNRLLQFVLPEHFSVTSPMTAHQFFRATGGFVLQKAKLVRNIAALFSRREKQLEQEEQNRVDAAAHQEMLMERSRKYNIMRQCGVGDDLAYLQFEPRPILDGAGNYAALQVLTNLTARQRVELAERQRKAEMERKIAAIKLQEKNLNEIAHQARATNHQHAYYLLENNNNKNISNNNNKSKEAMKSPLSLLIQKKEHSANDVYVISEHIEAAKRREQELERNKLLVVVDQAFQRPAKEDEELVEEGVMLVSPERKRRN